MQVVRVKGLLVIDVVQTAMVCFLLPSNGMTTRKSMAAKTKLMCSKHCSWLAAASPSFE